MKKGFILMETIVVIVIVSVALLTIFSSYNKILNKSKSENKYDTSEYIYMTYHVKQYLKTQAISIIDLGENPASLTSVSIVDLSSLSSNIKKAYILTGIGTENFSTNLKYFDAYMIDYLKKLDINENSKILVVEYKRPSLEYTGAEKIDTNNSKLYETYIASLEW